MATRPHLRYGENTTLELNLGDSELIAHCGVPHGEPLDDVVAAVSAALVEPVDFPAIAEATVPGDHIAIAIEKGIPQIAEVIMGIVQPLLADGTPIENLSVVLAATDQDIASIQAKLPEAWNQRLNIKHHDPHDNNGLAYLAATQEGEPIYINRLICDADLAIPVGCIRVDGSLGYLGVQGSIFPSFADAKSQERFATPLSALAEPQRKILVHEMEEAAWLLGARLTVQIIPGNGDTLLHVVAGDIDSVASLSQKLATTAWESHVQRRSELVIAAIEGGSEQQTWDNFSRCLMAATRVANQDQGGAIAILSELEEAPSPALMRMMGGDDFGAEEIDPETGEAVATEGAFAAEQLAETLKMGRVYLLSRLSEDIISQLGLAYVSDPREIANLTQRHNSTIILSNAQHVWPSLKDAVSS